MTDVDTQRQRLEQRRRRLVRMYADELMNDAEYSREKLELDALASAVQVVPRNETIDAGAYLENLGALWS